MDIRKKRRGVVPFILVIFLLTALQWATASADYSTLVDGVTQIANHRNPSPVWADSEAWVPIASGDEDTSFPSTFVMAREYNSGRIVIMGENGFFKFSLLSEYDNEVFALNTISWLRNAGSMNVGYTSGHSEWYLPEAGTDLYEALQDENYNVTGIAAPIGEGDLDGISVLIVGNAWGNITEAEIDEIKDFVSSGGGLLMLGLGWSWPSRYEFEDYPMMKLASPFEARWLDRSISDPTDQYPDYPSSPIFQVFYPDITAIGTIFEAFSVIEDIHISYSVNPEDPEDPDYLAAQIYEHESIRIPYVQAHSILSIPSLEFSQTYHQHDLIYDFYHQELQVYPGYFTRDVFFDPDEDDYFYCFAQARERAYITLIDSKIIDSEIKSDIATAAALSGRYADIWDEFSIFLLDNGHLNGPQKEFIYNFLSVFPSDLHSLRYLSDKIYYCREHPEDHEICYECPGVDLSTSGGRVNMTSWRIGDIEFPAFPADAYDPGEPVHMAEHFSITLAHEVNHNVNATIIWPDQELSARMCALIDQMAPQEIVFQSCESGHRINLDLTKQAFQAAGLWDGIEDWDTAWERYWDNDPPGAGYLHDDYFLRSLKTACESPQEVFASLSNLYFADSRIMLDLSLRRWDRGIDTCINQFLFFADIYSQGTNETIMYRTEMEGNIDSWIAHLRRDDPEYTNGISGISFCDVDMSFDLNSEGDVINITKTTAADLVLIRHRLIGNQYLNIYDVPDEVEGEINPLTASDTWIGNVGTDYEITHMAAGDMDGDGTDEIIFIRQQAPDNQYLTIYDIPTVVEGEINPLLASDTLIGNVGTNKEITHMAAGDKEGDCTDELIFIRHRNNENQYLNIYDIPTVVGGEINPIIASDLWIGNVGTDNEITHMAVSR